MKKNYLLLLALFASLSAFSQLNVTFRSQLTFPGKSCANIWGYTDSLNREFALVGTTAGMSIVNVTNPTTPVLLFNIAGVNSQWREIKTHGKYAYVTTEGGAGLQIVNLSFLPDSAPSKLWTGNGAIAGLSRIHALHIDGGFAYLYGCRNTGNSYLFNGSALICSLSDPWNPNFVGHTSTGVSPTVDYIHDGQALGNKLYGGHIYQGQFSIYDITNKAAPVLLNKQTTPTAFCHNTWLNGASDVVFTTDETSNSFLASYNVSNPNNIQLLDKIQSQNPGSGSIIHNTYIKNEYAVSSYYRDGFTIVDAARPANLVLTGWYDTAPGLSGNGFNGAWGVYPYFPSGNIVVSDIESGLFVFTPTYTRACYLEGLVTDSATGLAINAASIQVTGPATLNESSAVNGEYKTGTVVSGTYTVTVSKAGYVTKTITNVVLQNGVLTNLNVALSIPRNSISGDVFVQGTFAKISGAYVRIENPVLGTTTTTADVNGHWIINNFYPGTYTVTVGRWSYITKCSTFNFNAGNAIKNDTLTVGIYDDFTFSQGWKPSNLAKRGKWVRTAPVGTTFVNPNDANPNSDASTDCSSLCYVTGNGGGTADNDDVDSGEVKLNSPYLNLTGYSDPYIHYSRWFFASPGSNDTMEIKLFKGSAVAFLEKVNVGSSGNSSWKQVLFRVKDFHPVLGTNMRFIVLLKDRVPEHILEAGFDHFYITEGPAPPPFAVDQTQITNKITFNKGILASLFPNPTKDVLYLELNNLENESVQIEITDLLGKVLVNKTYTNTDEQISINTNLLPNSGLYILKATSGNETYTYKFVKE
ncbi:MAG: choice-of-anchor B family protein [Bacteroidetes bacterium]|nr:choice-of-anchor B family protein [Bacteroidota bacterium]